MRVKVKKQVLSFLLCAALIGNIFPVNSVAAEKDVYALTYHVGAYDMFPESDGSISVMIDGKKYYYSDDFDDEEIATKISGMENQNVVYELHDSKIVKVYTMDEVLSQEVTVEPSVKDGLTYRKGKFSQKSFELVVKVSNNLQGDFKKNDLLWFLSESEKNCLYSTLKKLEIKPSNEVDFGSSGWWMWKEYEKTISENMNDVIRAEETKEYKYTVNLHNDGVVNQPKYDINIYATPTFDTGVGRRAEGKIQVGNLDYQEEKTEEKKATSNAGKSVAQAATTLDGIQNAIQFSNDLFSADQIDQINKFVNMWMSELLLAKYVDKSDLKEKVSEKIANELLKKLGLDTSVLAIPGEIRATTYLETQTKDGSRVFIQFNIDLMNFDFGNSGMPTMATGSGTANVYNMDGEELNSSVILPVYANVCAFCEQLQQVAKDTIFNGAKEYLGIFGISAESTAEAMSSQIMAKVLNNKYTKDAFKMVDAKDVKKVLKNIIVDGEKTVNKKIFKLITTPSQGSTEVSVKCPVDLKIYDNDGNLCGLVKDNTVDSTYDDIFVNVVGDQKNIYLVGDDYSFEMTGTDNGSMDYVVREFDDDGNTTREIAYENIKLSNGCKYYSYVPEAVNHSNTLFDLTDNKGNVILPTKGADTDSIIGNTGGQCGDDVYWELSEDGILRIWGNGKMYGGEKYNGCPWKKLYNDKITAVVIEEGVTCIGNAAFKDCSGLTSATISDSVTSIGDLAFENCSNLKDVVIPDNVISIGSGEGYFYKGITYHGGVFENCSSLEKISIPDSVTFIGICTFKDCSGLTSVTISDSVTSIGDGAFENCSNLKDVVIPDNVISIGSEEYYWCGGVFENCSSLEKISIPDSVAFIGESAFEGCSSLKEIVIPKKVSLIKECTFKRCKSLKEIIIPNGVTSIKGGAFYACTNLQTIIIPNSVKSIEMEDGIFDGGAFEYCDSLKEIIIPDSVVSIGDITFRSCENLEKITLPDNLTEMGSYIFSGCSRLEKIVLPNSLGAIPDGTFDGCGIKEFTVPNSVTSIGENVFRGSGRAAWRGCLEKIIIPENVIYIASNAFDEYYRKYVTIFGKKGSYAHTYAIEHNIKFSDMSESSIDTKNPGESDNLGIATGSPKPTEGANTTENSKPTDGTNATNIPLKGTILEDNKKTVTYKVTAQGKSVTFYKANNRKTEKIIIPATITINEIEYKVTAISDSAFSGCNRLKSVSIGKYVTSIGNKAFFKCTSLKKITIPASVTKIGKKAFWGCKKLRSIIIKTKKLKSKSVGTQAFKGIYKKAVIKVHKKQKKAYTKWLRKKGITKKMKIK